MDFFLEKEVRKKLFLFLLSDVSGEMFYFSRVLLTEKMRIIHFILMFFAIVSCASLSDGGSKVVIRKEESKNCSELGNVSAGESGFSHGTTSSIKNSMRNQVFELGGNVLVIDNIHTIANGVGGHGGYGGSGRAFSCKDNGSKT